jgi:hypothetical protein
VHEALVGLNDRPRVLLLIAHRVDTARSAGTSAKAGRRPDLASCHKCCGAEAFARGRSPGPNRDAGYPSIPAAR